MNLLLVSQHIIFDESSFPFASSDMLPNDLNSLFSSNHAPRLTPNDHTRAHVARHPSLCHTWHRCCRLRLCPRHAQSQLHASPNPLVYQRRLPVTTLEPSRDKLSVHHPVTVASDPTAPTQWSPIMLLESPSPWIIYNSPPPLLPRHFHRSRPLSVAHSRTPIGIALWRRIMRPCYLTTHETSFLSLIGPMSSPASGSSSTSSRWMAHLTDTRIIGSSRSCPMHQLDVKNIFLHGTLSETVYCS
jgi:hypothetical protein